MSDEKRFINITNSMGLTFEVCLLLFGLAYLMECSHEHDKEMFNLKCEQSGNG